ncbi:hypothetical protein [Methylorubrum extorquens]
MQINAPFNAVSAARARDLLGVTPITNALASRASSLEGAQATIITDLDDAKKRLDQPWGNPVTYYGAVRSQTQDSSAAFQTAANLGFINVPGGDFVIDAPIVTTEPLVIQGAGQYARAGSRLLARVPGLVMFQHNLNTAFSTAYKEPFVVKAIELTTMANGPARAFDIRLNDAPCLMTDVRFSSFSSDFNWRNLVRLQGATAWNKFSRIHADGGSFNPYATWNNQTAIGFELLSSNSAEKTFGAVFDNCDIMAIEHGVFAQVLGGPGNNGSIEGIVFRDCFGRTANGPWYRLFAPDSNTFWRSPWHVFERLNYEGPGKVCDIDSAGEIHFDQCLFYGGDKIAGSNPPVEDFIRIRRFETLHFDRNTVRLYNGTRVATCLSSLFGGDGMWVRDNVFQVDTGATVGGGIFVAEGSTNVFPATGNVFRNWPANVIKYAGIASA